MKGTCNFKDCYFAGLLEKAEQCPNHLLTWWQPEGKGEPAPLNDCAPKRTVLMIQEIHNRIIGVQKSHEEVRNANENLVGAFAMMAKAIHENPDATIEFLAQKPQQLLTVDSEKIS